MVIEFEMNNATGASSGSIVALSDLLLLLGIQGTATALETSIATESLSQAESAIRRHLKYDPVQSVRTEYLPSFDFAGQDNPILDVNANQAFIRNLAIGVGNELQLSHLPVRQCDANGNNSIQIWVDFDGRSGSRSGSFANDTLKVEGSDFFPNYDSIDVNSKRICRDGIIRSNGLWPAQAGSVKVVYLAGYTAAELVGSSGGVDASPIRSSVLDEAIRRVHRTYTTMKRTRIGFGTGALTSESLGDYSYSADAAALKDLVGRSYDILPETAHKLEDFVNYGAFLL